MALSSEQIKKSWQPVIRRLLFPLILLVFALLLALRLPHYVGRTDFAEYWSAARLFVGGQNPYDIGLLAQEQRIAGPLPGVIRMWNPPWIFSLIWPLALGSFEAWRLLSLCLHLWLIFLIAVHLLRWPEWKLHDQRSKLGRLALLATFPPFHTNLWHGQSTVLLLAGLTFYMGMSLRFEEKPRAEFFSAAALALLFLKPHLLYLPFLLLFLMGRWRSIGGLLFGAALLSLIPLAVNPEVFAFYLESLKTPPIHFHTPTIGSWLQFFSGLHSLWLRCLPSALTAIIVTLWHFGRKSRKHPNILEMFCLFTPLSLVTAPYGWDFDQALLLPAMVWGLSIVENNRALLILMVFCNVLFLTGLLNKAMPMAIWYPVAVQLILLYCWGKRLRV